MARPLVKPIRTLIPGRRNMPHVFVQTDTIYPGQKSGTTVDAFKSKIRDQRSASSAYSMDALKVHYGNPIAAFSNYRLINGGNPTSGWHTVNVKEYFEGYFDNIQSPNLVLTHKATTSAVNETESLSRAYSNFKSSYESMNSLNFLGEFGETMRMLRNPASALAKNTGRFLDTLTSTRKEVRSRVKPRKSDTPQSLRRRRMNSVKDAVSGSWLEFAFGWTPLVNDVKDIAETAVRALEGSLPTFKSNGTSRAPNYIGPFWDPQTAIFQASNPVRCRRVSSTSSGASVRYTVIGRSVRTGPSESLSELARLSGFTLENVIPTAYQLAPWSFLIDYFVNLGDVIEAWSMDQSSIVTVVKTLRQSSDFVFTEELFQMPSQILLGGYYSGLIAGNAVSRRVLTRTTLTRTVLDSLPMPSLRCSIPGIDSTKWINMAALLAQAKAFRF